MSTLILGSGIAGISAAYHLKKQGRPSVILEKDNDWGGLCSSFCLNGFRFDRFVHFSFAPDGDTQQLFCPAAGMYEHAPACSNYYHGTWLKHPAQNNLFPLSAAEKFKIIAGFVCRPRLAPEKISDYATWLRAQYGRYFAEHFPFVYTRKYWGLPAQDLETKWVGVRMNTPSLKQVLQGALKEPTQNFYYTSVMRYPKKGGFRAILNKCREGLTIACNKEVIAIEPANKTVTCKDGTQTSYTRLISTLPLPEIVNMLPNVPPDVRQAAGQLRWTCGYQISLGFNRPDVAKHLWFYIYDEDIPPARIYSPNLKSPDNVPPGCSSLQAEVFFDCRTPIPPAQEVLAKTLTKLQAIGLFTDKDIVVQDIRFEKYANITFVPDIYKNRQIVRDYLAAQGIESIGRFGRWEYFWTHQAFSDGKTVI